MAISVISCQNGVISTSIQGDLVCSGTFVQQEIQATYISASDFNDMWPLLVLMFVSAYIVKIILRMFDQNASRN